MERICKNLCRKQMLRCEIPIKKHDLTNESFFILKILHVIILQAKGVWYFTSIKTLVRFSYLFVKAWHNLGFRK